MERHGAGKSITGSEFKPPMFIGLRPPSVGIVKRSRPECEVAKGLGHVESIDESIEVILLPLLEKLLLQAEQGKNLAHITQGKTETLKAYDRAMAQLETFVQKTAEKRAVKKAANH